MKKLNKERGITLVALIITIIVLLILAVVTIAAVTGDSIINHAENARDAYKKGMEDENSILKYYEDYLVGQTNKWKEENGSFTNGDITISKWAKVNYVEGSKTYTSPKEKTGADSNQELSTDDLEWRVLGVNSKGQIELISTAPTEETLTLKGATGYMEGPDELNNICNKLYGTGNGAAGARSLNVDDVDVLCGITTEAQKAENDSENQYGKTFYFKYANDRIEWSEDNQTYENFSHIDGEHLYLPDGTIINSTNIGPISVEDTAYQYSIPDNIIFDNFSLQNFLKEEKNQWISSIVTDIHYQEEKYVDFQMNFISNQGVRATSLYGSDNYVGNNSFSLRPVVTLQSNVQLVKDANGVYQIQ